MQKSFSTFSFILVLTFAALVQANPTQIPEPAYCDLTHFRSLEITNPVRDLERPHIYRLGNITLAGLGVGSSEARDVVRLAKYFSSSTPEEGFCTWYFNKGNDEAERIFNHNYVSKPSSNARKAADEYNQKLAGEFDRNQNNFVKCAETRGYLAIGCNGMKHRGPSVFGMLLAYSGCSPQKANLIVNKVWGLNGVKEATRLAIIQKGYEIGQQNPDASLRLQKHFLAQTR